MGSGEETFKLSPFIANALVHGENRPYNVALVVPELNALRRWAHDNGYQLGESPSTRACAK